MRRGNSGSRVAVALGVALSIWTLICVVGTPLIRVAATDLIARYFIFSAEEWDFVSNPGVACSQQCKSLGRGSISDACKRCNSRSHAILRAYFELFDRLRAYALFVACAVVTIGAYVAAREAVIRSQDQPLHIVLLVSVGLPATLAFSTLGRASTVFLLAISIGATAGTWAARRAARVFTREVHVVE